MTTHILVVLLFKAGSPIKSNKGIRAYLSLIFSLYLNIAKYRQLKDLSNIKAVAHSKSIINLLIYLEFLNFSYYFLNYGYLYGY